MNARIRWHSESHGGYLGHRVLYGVVRWLGPRIAELLVYPVAFFYFLVASRERRASDQYLTRVLGPTHWPGRCWRTFRHLLAFGRSYLDGVMLNALGPAAFTIDRNGHEHITALRDGTRGAVMVTAHVGAWELSSAALREEGGPRVAIVMFRSDEEKVQQLIDALHARRPRLIAVGEGDLAALEIMRAVRAGELVCMQGDRTVDAREVKVPFFGEPARWPVGPWIVAALSGAPLISTFAVRVGPRHYQYFADPPKTFRFDPRRSREEQLAEWVRMYVERLETLLRADPLQWFNFYDFWADAGPKP
jgi:predicted LPLAT superfamily acyltransferase